VPALLIDRENFFNKKALQAEKTQFNLMPGKSYFESQKLSQPMSVVPNRIPLALRKALAGKKCPLALGLVPLL
jgi:hypothetical protein